MKLVLHKTINLRPVIFLKTTDNYSLAVVSRHILSPPVVRGDALSYHRSSPVFSASRYYTMTDHHTRLVHLDVEDCSEELLRHQSYAIKNQLGHPKPPKILLLDARAGSLWHKTAGDSITREGLDQ